MIKLDVRVYMLQQKQIVGVMILNQLMVLGLHGFTIQRVEHVKQAWKWISNLKHEYKDMFLMYLLIMMLIFHLKVTTYQFKF